MMAVQGELSQLQALLLNLVSQLGEMVSNKQNIMAVAVLLLFGVLTGMILYHLVVINYKNFRVKRTFKSGRIAENAAVKFLRSHGYKI